MSLKISYLMTLFIASSLCITPMTAMSKTLDKDPWNVKDAKIVASWPKEDIYLYTLDWKKEHQEKSGVYKEIVLSVKGHERYFPCWQIDTNTSFKPEFMFSDIDSDGNKELIVVSVSGTGTGIYLSDIHVFRFDDKGSFYDVYVMEPLEGIYQNVKGKMSKKDGIVTIIINVKGKDYIFTAKESSLGFWGTEVGFGNIIKYAVVDNKLTVSVNAQVGNAVTCAIIVMDYVFENNGLRISNAKFKKVNDKIFNYQLTLRFIKKLNMTEVLEGNY